ncbi:MAG: MoaD/ThiS family protein [Ferrimicrobium sp.]|jgi:molybdopterin converting factor small subunit|uniref:MoaD/ThiS family protein n=1 Tax=Ferrimicrobium acidiphilum TaxID=121039 RepID=A0ABV3Y002_9ACTN|nr:MoaD/ThiS family protein [Ferrimicrobium sp.]
MRVRFFGAAKAIAGTDNVEIVAGAANLPELIEALGNECGPELAALLPYCRFAVGSAVLDVTSTIPVSGEVVVLPPVSGGI